MDNLIRDFPLFLPFLAALVAGALRIVSPKLQILSRLAVFAGIAGSLALLVTQGAQLPPQLADSLGHLGLLIPLFSLGYFMQTAADDEPGETDRVMLLGFTTTGALLMAFGEDWILVGAGVEISSLPLAYFLVRKGSAVKGALYLLLAAGFGLVLLAVGVTFWATATGGLYIDLPELAGSGEITVATVLLFAALAYKVGWLPFAAWIPKVYRAGENRLVAFLATAPKIAVAILMFRMLNSAGPEVWPYLRWFVWLSMGLGVIGGLAQRDLRVLLGYSGISHMGYALLIAARPDQTGAVLFAAYVAAYGLATWGAFALLKPDPHGEVLLNRCLGATKRDPIWTLSFLLILLSQAGVPFVLGFWTKFLLFTQPAAAGAWLSVWIGLIASVIGLYMYLRVAKWLFVSTEETQAELPASTGFYKLAGVVIAVVLTVTGLQPGWFFGLFGG